MMGLTDKIIPWALGLLVSLVVGHFVTKTFLKKLRLQVGCSDEIWNCFVRKYDKQAQGDTSENFDVKFTSGKLQGIIERVVFTAFVAFDLSGTVVAMMGWLAVKMVTNLNRGDLPKGEMTRQRAMTGLLGGMVSMFFALVGGLLCRLKISI